MPKKNFFADDYSMRVQTPYFSIEQSAYQLYSPTPVFIPNFNLQMPAPVDEVLPINPKFYYQMPEYPIEQPAYPVYSAPVFSPAPVDEVFPVNPKFYYPMPKYPIEQPAYPVEPQPIFATPTPEPAPINPKFYYPMPEYIEQPAYPVQPILPTLESGIDFGTPRGYEVPEVPKFDVEPPTLYTPLPDYPIEQPAYTVMPTPDTPIKTVEPYSPIDEFIPPVTDVPPFSDDIETGGVVKSDVEPVKPDDFVDTQSTTTSTETKLPETKPVSKNLTPYVYAGLGIVVILLVARMVTKKD